MAVIYNASSQTQQVRIFGSYFTFPPKAMKVMDPDKVFFLTSKCAHLGFVQLPDELEDLEYKASEEGKKVVREAEARGIASRIAHLEWHKNNEMNSLRKDMDRDNDKSDVSSQMDSESIQKLEAVVQELTNYKKSSKNEASEKADRLKKIQAALEE